MRKLPTIAAAVLASMIITTGSAQSQPSPSDPIYFRSWLRSQISAWEQVQEVRFREETVREMDGPTGTHTARVTSLITAYPEERDFDREILSAEMNGRTVPRMRLNAFAGRWRQFSRDLSRATSVASDWRLRILGRMRPTGRPQIERYGDLEAYRVDLTAPELRADIDRITLWFDRHDGRLLASRAILDPRGPRGSMVVETRYRRIREIDVPVFRSIDGSVQTKRRLRYFTTLVNVESRFDDFRFEMK